MRAGMFDRRITVERHSGALNEMNEPTPDGWAEIATLSASVREEMGREYLQREQQLSTRRAVFVIRNRRGIEPTDRVIFEGVVFDIKGWREIGRREGHELFCESVA